MEKQILVLEAQRECYSVEHVTDTMTAGELIAYLEQFDEDTPVYLSHDKGYTYGGIRERDFWDEYMEEE